MSKDNQNKVEATASMVEVLTWGSHYDAGNGMTHFIDSTLFGGNVGHASLLVTFPANEEGQALIKQYCLNGSNTVLPFERKTMQVKDENGKVKTQEVYQVYFSWWPSSTSNFRLETNPNNDGVQERDGVNVGPRAERFAEDPSLNAQEIRIARGMVGSKQKHLAPNQISMDLSSLDTTQQEIIQHFQNKNQLQSQIDSMEVIVKKLPETTDNIVMAGTLLNLIQQYLPDWKTHLGLREIDPSPRRISADQATILRNAINLKIEESKVQIAELDHQINLHVLVAETANQQAIIDEVTLLSEIYEHLPPDQQKRMLQNRESFSVRAWNAFEMALVDNEKNLLNEFTTFISQNYDFLTDEKSKENVLNALFSNQLPEHTELAALKSERPEIEARMQSTIQEITAKEAEQAKLETLSAEITLLNTELNALGSEPENEARKQIITQEIAEKETEKSRIEGLPLEIELLNSEKAGLQKKLDRIAKLESPEMQAGLNLKLTNINQAFRQHLPREYQKMPRESFPLEVINSAKESIKSRSVVLMTRKMELEAEKPLLKLTDPIMGGNYGRFVSLGLKPDHKLMLPISGIADGTSYTHNEKALPGLNVERMLKKMRELTDDGIGFDITTKNCSVTSAAILSAGAEPELKTYFERKALGGFGNPQEVYNGVLKYQNTIILHGGKKSLSERIAEANPLNYAGNLTGRMLSNLVDPNLGKPAKVGIGILLPPVAAAAAVVETGKALLQPLNTFKKQIKFIDYAFKNNSLALKVLAAPVAIMAGMLSPFAGVELGIRKAIIEPIGNLSQNRQRDKALANDPFQEAKTSDNTVNAKEQNIQPATGNTPEEVVQNMHSILDSNPSAIPELDATAQKALQGSMSQETRARLLDAQEKTRTRIYASQPPTTVPQQAVRAVVDNQQTVQTATAQTAAPSERERSSSTPRR